MGKEAEFSEIIKLFPGLATDADFDLTSPQTTDYNCIAWASNYKDRWMQPPNGMPLFDGVTYWPDNATPGTEKECLVEAFAVIGYKECSAWEHEEGYQKVALYEKSGNWSHAARELMIEPHIGKWTSKLGRSYDIRHGTPFAIEGEIYGHVYCIMKRQYK